MVCGAREYAIAAILLGRNVGQRVITPFLKEAASQEVMLQRFRRLGKICSRGTRIHERLSYVRSGARSKLIRF